MWLRRRSHLIHNFWCRSLQWGLLPKYVKYNSFVSFFLYCPFFSIERPEPRGRCRPTRFMGHMTWFRPRTVLFGIRTMSDITWGKCDEAFHMLCSMEIVTVAVLWTYAMFTGGDSRGNRSRDRSPHVNIVLHATHYKAHQWNNALNWWHFAVL